MSGWTSKTAKALYDAYVDKDRAPHERSIDSRVDRPCSKLRDGDGDGALQRPRTVRNRGYVFSPLNW